MTEKKRWSMNQSRARAQPRGSIDALDRAKRALVPIFRSSEHQPELKTICSCEDCLEKNVRDVAGDYNARVLLLEGAPRRKTVANNLAQAVSAIRVLRDALVGLDDFSRKLLSMPEKDDPDIIRFYLTRSRWYESAEAADLPQPEPEDAPASYGRHVERLEALERYVSQTLEEFVGDPEEEDLRTDRGGSTNLMKEEIGPPAWYLVKMCWYFFQTYRPGEATASENGPFLHFCNCVHEFATGEVEENPAVLYWAKKIARPARHHDEVIHEYFRMEIERDELKTDPPTRERDARIAELEAQLPIQLEKLMEATKAMSFRNL